MTIRTHLEAVTESQNHRITQSQNGRGWKGPQWVIVESWLDERGHGLVR